MKGYETLHYPFIYYHLPLKNHESEAPFYKNIYPFFNMKNEISIAKTFKPSNQYFYRGTVLELEFVHVIDIDINFRHDILAFLRNI